MNGESDATLHWKCFNADSLFTAYLSDGSVAGHAEKEHGLWKATFQEPVRSEVLGSYPGVNHARQAVEQRAQRLSEGVVTDKVYVVSTLGTVVYRTEAAARSAIVNALADDAVMCRLSDLISKTVKALLKLDQPELAIDIYNEFVPPEQSMIITETVVRD